MRLVKSPREGGMAPFKLQPASHNICKEESLEIESGMGPGANGLYERFSCRSVKRSPRKAGTVPERRLLTNDSRSIFGNFP